MDITAYWTSNRKAAEKAANLSVADVKARAEQRRQQDWEQRIRKHMASETPAKILRVIENGGYDPLGEMPADC